MGRLERTVFAATALVVAGALVVTAALHGAHRHGVQTCGACALAAGGAFLPPGLPIVPCLLVFGRLVVFVVPAPSAVAQASFLVRGPPR